MRKINFKVDESKHNGVVDWWYFNGILKSKGATFSYMTCLFKVDPKILKYLTKLPNIAKNRINDFYFSHTVVTNLKTKETEKEIYPLVLASQDSFTRPLLFVNYTPLTKYLNYEIKKINDTDYIVKAPNFDLKLQSLKKPLLECNTGLIKYKHYYTYYYSLTDLKTKGLLRWKNKWYEVEGKSWHDHQWMNKLYAGEQWDWFSIQLDNNEDIVCARLRANEKDKWHYFATRINKNGKTETTYNVEFIENEKTTINKRRYTTNWDILIPKWNLELNAKAVNKSQEMDFGPIKYWEGPLVYKSKNSKLKGQGFGEFIARKSV